MNRLLAIILLLFFLFCPAAVFAQAEILNLRHWAAPEHTRIVIDTSEEVQFTMEKSDKKILLKLENTAILKIMPHEYILNKPGITKITIRSLPESKIAIELFLTEKANANIFKLKKFQDKPYRVVADIVLPEVEKEKTRAREEVKASRKDKIIIIDPGHGGEDPGAIGYGGVNEKDLVLEISKKLRDAVNAGQGTRAFLTREDDYYVPFKKRLNIAREYGADLFISIHADAAKNKKAKGSSVYCLSARGAGSEASKILARKENMADIVGGTLNETDANGQSDPIILDMFQTNTINMSKKFGSKILKNFRRINTIKFAHVQEAPLRVLKLPEIPAALIETAYISNPQEEDKLQSKRFQMEIAEVIYNSVRDFFSLPAVASAEPVPKASEKATSASLTEPEQAAEEPVLKTATKSPPPSSSSRPEQAVKGPVLKTAKQARPTSSSKAEHTAEEPAVKTAKKSPSVSIHKVKKGETLAKIAARNGTELSVLLKMNKMKLEDPLYVDRKIVLPAVADEEKEKKEGEKVEKNATKTAVSKQSVKRKPTARIHKNGQASATVAKSEDSATLPSSKKSKEEISYKVKKGDTLDKVAHKYGTSVSSLLKLNRMKMRDPLFVGREIKITAQRP